MFYLPELFTFHTLNQLVLRHFLTGSVDHASRLFKSNLATDPICPFCQGTEETAEHIFWVCQRWHFIRTNYPTLPRLIHLTGSLWPACFLNCGWIEQSYTYGFELLDNLDAPYTLETFTTKHAICICLFYLFVMKPTRFYTPSNLHSPPHSIHSSPSRPYVQPQEDVSPFSISSG